MRSIAHAMTWETLARGRWAILTASLAAVAFPTIFVNALHHDRFIEWQDPLWINLHMAMAMTTIFICALALRTAQGTVAKLFSMPVTTSQIVIWTFLPASFIVALQFVGSTLIVNALFGIKWPVLGPALVAAAALPATTAVIWLTEKSAGWLSFGVAVVGALIGLWFKSRYGAPFSPPKYYWPVVTLFDFSMFCLFVGSAYAIGVVAIARNRRGEPPINLGIAAWVERQFSSRNKTKEFKSVFQAQSWCEWQRNGWAMPFGLIFLLVIGLIGWLVFDRSTEGIAAGLLFGNIVILVLATIGGLICGNVNSKDASYAMGHFLATRPTSDSELARVILVGVAKSLLVTWIVWSVVSAIAYGYVSILHIGDMPDEVNLTNYFYTLVGSWVVASVLACLGLMGRSKVVFQTFCVLIGALFLGMILLVVAVPPDVVRMLAQITVVVFDVVILCGTALIFVEASRRSLIHVRTAWAAGGVWLIALLAAAMPAMSQSYSQLFLLAVVFALALSPIAGAPLAISLNRHR